ncbi:glucose-6-phosphate 1-epimerase [Diaphorina citri]|uniref:glucose-6-phosphate 1-epimerase n=1 Tax=Diaphorina citri TaxID=121845 RepID=A0A1S3DBM9_DIACI|nr:glucose-6-phosphate 1-epimerase [Diaphorina citri]
MALATSVVMMDRGNNTTCTINLHGATVVSWRVNNQEQLFVSKSAVFDGKRPIRGGIPIVFPQFGAWAFGPQHGFARNITWTVEKRTTLPTLNLGPLPFVVFRLTYRLILREKELHFNIGVYNPSNDLAFNFNLLLHTYLKVPDVRRCQVNGLYGCHYIDKVLDNQLFRETRETVSVSSLTDRIYQNTCQEHVVTNVVSGRKMRLQKYNFPDTVIWNPWDTGRDMKDFGDDEYPNMICVEAGHVTSPVLLHPGTTFEASQILQVM